MASRVRKLEHLICAKKKTIKGQVLANFTAEFYSSHEATEGMRYWILKIDETLNHKRAKARFTL